MELNEYWARRVQPLFWDRVLITDCCWVWLGPERKGYGAIHFAGISTAHRVSYVLTGNELGREMILDHLCLRKGCVNPSHLEQVTRSENSARIFYPKWDKYPCTTQCTTFFNELGIYLPERHKGHIPKNP